MQISHEEERRMPKFSPSLIRNNKAICAHLMKSCAGDTGDTKLLYSRLYNFCQCCRWMRSLWRCARNFSTIRICGKLYTLNFFRNQFRDGLVVLHSIFAQQALHRRDVFVQKKRDVVSFGILKYKMHKIRVEKNKFLHKTEDFIAWHRWLEIKSRIKATVDYWSLEIRRISIRYFILRF